MLPELYRPSCVADLAWSREKREALLSSMQEQLCGNTNTHIHLLYGPSGCGKLSAVEVLFRQAVCNVNMSSSNCNDINTLNRNPEIGRHVEINTFHTCDNSASAYGQFLQRVILLLTSSLDNVVAAAVHNSNHNEANQTKWWTTKQGNESSSGALTLQEYTMEDWNKHNTEEENKEYSNEHQCKQLTLNRHVEKREHAINARAFIVKLYGEDASDYLHRYTREFVWAYESICESALRWYNSHHSMREVKNSKNNGKKENVGSVITKILQYNQIFFIHTIHDTHSPKVDLTDSIPSELLNSNWVSLFHCTPITHINMMRRLCDVVNAEVNKSAFATCNKASTTISPTTTISHVSQCDKTPAKMSQKGISRKRMRKSQLLQVNQFISVSDVEIIAQSSQGDLRQALLQTQWVLLAPTMQVSTERTENVQLEQIKYEEQQQQQQELKSSAKCNSVDEEVVFVKEVKQSKCKGHNCKNVKKEVIERTSKNSVVKHLTECKREDSVSVLDLLTQQEEESEEQNAALAPHKECSNDVHNGSCKKDDDNDDGGGGGGGKDAAGNASDLNSETVDRISVVTVRDEYLGLSHATGRLLTQKYALWDVLRLLNVSSRKVLDYLTNNMPAYFASDQIHEYALCASCASECDALREGTIAYNNEVYRHTYETEQDDEAIVISMSHNLLDYMSLVVFDKTYRVQHHSVSVPRTFMPQRPPPFMPHAYPRLRCNSASRFTTYSNTISKNRNRNYSLTSVDDNTPILRSSVDVYNSFMTRLDAAAMEKARGANSEVTPNRDKGSKTSLSKNNASFQPITRTAHITSEEEDIVRECLPCLIDRCGCSESVITDYYPLAQYIILNRVNTLIHDVPNTNVKLNDESKTTLPSFFQHADRATKVINIVDNATSSNNTNNGNNTISGQSARRTTFRFTAQNEQAMTNKSLSVGQFTTTMQKRSCNELQFKLLRRGLQPNTFIREEFFYINTNASEWNTLSSASITLTESSSSTTQTMNSKQALNTVQTANARSTHSIRPMIPINDVIEDFSD